MPNKNINYSYTGDTSSLEKATKHSIELLRKYGKAVQDAAGRDAFKSSEKEIENLRSSIQRTLSPATRLTSTFKEFAKYQERMSGYVNGIDRMIDSQTRLTKSARESAQVFKEFLDHKDKMTGYINGIDQMIDKQKKLTKSAKESARVFNEVYYGQNKYNYKVPGYNKDASFRPSKSAEESAKAFGGLSGKILDITSRASEAAGTSSTANAINKIGVSAANAAKSTGLLGTVIALATAKFKQTKSEIESVDSSLSGLISAIPNFGKAVASGIVAPVGNITTSTEAAIGAIKVFKGVVLDGARVTVEFIQSLYKLSAALVPKTIEYSYTALKKFVNLVSSAGDKISDFAENLVGGITNTAQLVAGSVFGGYLAEATKSAIDMAEAVNLFTVAMKDNIYVGNEFIETTSEMFGLDPTNLRSITGLFYEMGAAVDVPTDALSKMSLGMTALALNVSSLFNVDIDTVADNLTSGLRGMSRAVVKYGMDLRASTVQAYTESLGITENFENMNEASREVARYLVMVKQAADANRDFAETIEQPANQLRILKEQIVQLGRTIGRYFVQAFKDVIPVINGVIMAIRLVLEAFASFLGIFTGESTRVIASETEDVASGVGGIGDAADDTTNKLQDMLAPFDELNILAASTSDASDGIGGIGADELVDPRLLAELEKVESQLGTIRMKAIEVRDAILDFLGLKYNMELDPITGDVLNKLEMIPGGFADQLYKAWANEEWSKIGTLIAKKLNTLLDGAVEKVRWSNVGNKITEKIQIVATALNAFIRDFNWYDLGAVIGASINTALRTVITWLQSFDFESWGVAIANAANGVFNELDVGVIGVAIAEWLNKGISFATGFATTFDWQQFSSQLIGSLYAFFTAIKVEEFFSTATAIINHLISALSTLVFETPWTSVKDSIVSILTTTFSEMDYMEFIEAALAIIWHLIDALLEFIATNDWTPVKDGIVNILTWFFEEAPYMDFLRAAIAIINHMIDALVSFVSEADWGVVKQNIISALDYIFETAKIEEFIRAATELVVHFIDALVTWINSNHDKFREIGSAIGEALARLNWGELLLSAISAIGSALWSGIKSYISSSIGGLFGGSGNKASASLGPPITSPHLSFGMATGGVVTGPTRALIGEGLYDEAVIPLGNSPQMLDLLEKFASITQRRGSSEPVEVRVFIGDKEWDAFTYESAERGKELVGATPIKERS